MPVTLHQEAVGAGPPLILLHAFPLSSEMWAEQRSGLSDRCRVVTPDQRGFGGSPLGDHPPSLDVVADDVAALLDDIGLDDVVLGGLSMGGYAAMTFLRRHPGRVRALVLADTKASADPPDTAANRERIAGRLDTEGTAAALVEEVLPKLLGPTTLAERPGVADRVRAQVESCLPAAAAWAQRAMAARPDSFDVLAATDVPALVIWGDEDELSTRADVEAMVAALPRGELVVLKGAGHLTAVEAPEAFTKAVHDFLAQVAG